MEPISIVKIEVNGYPTNSGDYSGNSKKNYPANESLRFSYSNGKRKVIPIPIPDSIRSSYLLAAKDGYRFEIENPQVFTNDKRSTFVIVLGMWVRYYGELGDFGPEKGAHKEQSFLWSLGGKKLIPFGPSFWNKVHFYSQKTQLKDFPLSQGSFSVSPNGDKILGLFKGSKSSELWQYNKTGSGNRLWKSSNKALLITNVPKFAVTWTNRGFYWAPSEMGPLYYKPIIGRMLKVLDKTPIFLDIKNDILFSLTTNNINTTSPKLTKGITSFSLLVSRIARKKTGAIKIISELCESPFKIFPNMPEFVVQPMASNWYFTPSDPSNYYVFNPVTRDISKVSRYENNYDLMTSKFALAPTYREPGYISVTNISMNEAGGPYFSRNSRVKSFQLQNFSKTIYSTTIFLDLDGLPTSFYMGAERNGQQDDSRYFRAYNCGSNGISKYPLGITSSTP